MKERILTIFLGKTVDIKTVEWGGSPPEWTSIKATEFPLSPFKTLPFRKDKYMNKSLMGISPLSSEPLLKNVPIMDRPLANSITSEITDKKARIVFADSTGQVDNGLAYRYSSLFSFNFDTRLEPLLIENEKIKIIMERILYYIEGMDETSADKQSLAKIIFGQEIKKRQFSIGEAISLGRQNQ